ncbi:unnamed protein product, partial [Ascophyllum nodosum]
VRLPSASNKRKGSPCASEKRPSQPYSKETSTIYYANTQCVTTAAVSVSDLLPFLHRWAGRGFWDKMTAMSTAKILLYTKTPIATPKTTISTPESIMPTSLYLQPRGFRDIRLPCFL